MMPQPITYRYDQKTGDIVLPDGPPFDGKPVLIKLGAGWVEAWWLEGTTSHDTLEEYDGFLWVCMDGDFEAELDSATYWMPVPVMTALVDDIVRAFGVAVFDDYETEEAAFNAHKQAITFALHTLPNHKPRVGISGDGVVTLQWTGSDGRGVLLVFVGNGTVSYSLKTGSHTTFGVSDVTGSVKDPLPPLISAAIDLIEKENP
jgi:hypothetical protein